jgi:RNA polymerase sigma-70 factor (ECF subfamily)
MKSSIQNSHSGMLNKGDQANSLGHRIFSGDRSAETVLVNRYSSTLFRSVTKEMPGQPDRARDIVQETFISALARLRTTLIADSDIYDLLETTASRISASDERRSRRTISEIESAATPSTTPSDSIEFSELVEMIGSLLEELPMQRDRDLLTRYLVHGDDKADIVKEYGLSSEHFDRILHRARVRLKNLLDKRRGGER